MYIPAKFNIMDTHQQHQFIQQHGFGVVVSASLQSSHLPFFLAPHEGEFGTLYAHCAKANSHWRELDDSNVLVIFNGPHTYISPSWYTHHPAVPTWNYSAVHAYGQASLVSKYETRQAIKNLVRQYESELLQQSTVLSEEHMNRLLPAIVGFKITITRLLGQAKLSQNTSIDNQRHVYQALNTSSRLDNRIMAEHMREMLAVSDAFSNN